MIFYLSTLFRKLFAEFPQSYLRPLSLICPVCSRHFTTINILGMSRLKARPFLLHSRTFASLGFACCFSTLLAEADRLNLIALLGDHHMRFRGMAWRALYLIVAVKAKPGKSRVFTHCSTIFAWRGTQRVMICSGLPPLVDQDLVICCA